MNSLQEAIVDLVVVVVDDEVPANDLLNVWFLGYLSILSLSLSLLLQTA